MSNSIQIQAHQQPLSKNHQQEFETVVDSYNIKKNQQQVAHQETVNSNYRIFVKCNSQQKKRPNYIENGEECYLSNSQRQIKLTNIIQKYYSHLQSKIVIAFQDFLKKILNEICPENKFERLIEITSEFLEKNKNIFQNKKKNNEKPKNSNQLSQKKWKTNIKDKNERKSDIILEDIHKLTAQIKTFESLLDRNDQSSDIQEVSHKSKAGSFFLGNLQDISNYDDFVFDFSPPNRGEEKVYLNNFENLPKSKSNKVNTFQKIKEIADNNSIVSVLKIRQIFKDQLRRTKVMLKLSHRNRTQVLKKKE